MKSAIMTVLCVFPVLLGALSPCGGLARAEMDPPRRLENDDAEDAALECFDCSRGELLTFDLATRRIVRRIPPPPGVPDIQNLLSGSGEGALVPKTAKVDRKDFGILWEVVNPLVGDYPKHVKLFGTFSTEGGGTANYSGSGTLIDPMHVLTAGHCVYTDEAGGEPVNDWAQSITVIPAYDEGDAPFGTAEAVQLHSWAGWTQNDDYDWDIGLIDLDRPVGALTGWRGYGSNPNCEWYTGGYWTHYGYPAESPYDGETMYTQSGTFDGCESAGNEVWFDQAMYRGQSGGGCLRDDGLYTVRSNLTCDPGCDTYDVRITNTMWYDLTGWIDADTPDTPDLIPMKVQVSGNATLGEFLSFVFLLHNYSSVTATGTWTVNCYISTDKIISPLDTQIGSVSVSGPIGPKGTSEEHVGINLSCGLNPGTYWLGVYIAYTDADPINNWTGLQEVAHLTIDPFGPAATPTTLSPVNGAVCRDRFDLPLSWSDLGPGYDYEVQIGTIPETGPVYSTTSASYIVTDLLAGTYYFWRVRAHHECAGWSQWSGNGWFRTEPNPAVVATVVSPEDGVHCIGSSTTLEWSPLDGAETYDVQISPAWCYEGDITTGIAGRQLSVSDLTPNTTYYWRVRCHNNCGQTTDWSSVPGFCFTFKTAPASIDPPTGLTPPDSTTCGSPDTFLGWQHAEDWDHYEVQVGTTCGAGSIYVTTGNGFTPPDLESGVLYHWRVRTFHECGLNSDWTDCRSFSLDLEPPTNPTTLFSSSHTIATWSSDNTIDVAWDWGSDDCDGVWTQYATLWDRSPTTQPTEPTTYGEITLETSPALADGQDHWFHLRAVDWAGNPAIETMHLGPFWIDTTAPSEVQIEWVSLPVNAAGDFDELTVVWAPSVDSLSGVAGYSYAFDEVPAPDDTIDTSQETVTLPMGWGTRTFRIAAIDAVGHMGPATDVGAFVSDPTLPAFLFPTAGQEVTEGEIVEVRWEPVNRATEGALYLSVDGGHVSEQIAALTGEDLENGLFSWTVPGEPTDEAVLTLAANTVTGWIWAASEVFSVLGLGDVDSQTPPASDLALAPNYPNPFNPRTTVAYTLPSATSVTIEILDVRGRHVKTLVPGTIEAAGRHEIPWDGTDDHGLQVPSGVYFCRLATPGFSQTRRMVLVK